MPTRKMKYILRMSFNGKIMSTRKMKYVLKYIDNGSAI